MKVWLYYANAGGGHRGPALAIAEELRRRYTKDVEIRFVDLAESSAVLRWVVEQGYAFSVHSAQWLYAFLYELSKWRMVAGLFNGICTWLVGRHIRKLLQEDRPDVIVATHFLIGPLVTALTKEAMVIPLYTVVTDPYSASPVWFYYRQVQYIVASEQIKKIAEHSGLSSGRMHIFPPIIRTTAIAKKTIDGLDPNQKIVLLVGGANGFPQSEKVLRALLQAGVAAQFVIVCGKNSVLQKKMESIRDKTIVKVVVYGHIDFLSALMSMADMVITKAGANTVFEVLLADKPLIITHYIWGQEKGNVDFVVRSGVGWYETRPEKVVTLVNQCLFDLNTQLRLQKARRIMKLTSGTATVVDFLMTNVQQKQNKR